MADKKKSFNVGKGITPAGKLIYPHLTKPDTKFKAEGEYRTRFALAGSEAQEFAALIDGFYEAGIEKVIDERLEEYVSKQKDPAKVDRVKQRAVIAKGLKRADKPYKPVLDTEGNETGEIAFTFKQRAKVTLKDKTVIEKKVDLFDAAKRPFPAGTAIYGGTVAKIAYEALPFFTPAVGGGITLRLNAVQVIELRTAGQRDADAYGFGDEGDGIEPSDESSAPSGDPTTPSDAGNNPDF